MTNVIIQAHVFNVHVRSASCEPDMSSGLGVVVIL